MALWKTSTDTLDNGKQNQRADCMADKSSDDPHYQSENAHAMPKRQAAHLRCYDVGNRTQKSTTFYRTSKADTTHGQNDDGPEKVIEV